MWRGLRGVSHMSSSWVRSCGEDLASRTWCECRHDRFVLSKWEDLRGGCVTEYDLDWISVLWTNLLFTNFPTIWHSVMNPWNESEYNGSKTFHDTTTVQQYSVSIVTVWVMTSTTLIFFISLTMLSHHRYESRSWNPPWHDTPRVELKHKTSRVYPNDSSNNPTS